MTPRVTGPRASPRRADFRAGRWIGRVSSRGRWRCCQTHFDDRRAAVARSLQCRGTGEPATFRDYLEACIQVVGCRPEIRWLAQRKWSASVSRGRKCPSGPVCAGAGIRTSQFRESPQAGLDDAAARRVRGRELVVFSRKFFARLRFPGDRNRALAPTGAGVSPRWGERGYDVIERPIAPNGNKISDGWRSAACFGLKVGFHDNEKPRLPAVRCIAGLGLSLCGTDSSRTTPSPTDK